MENKKSEDKILQIFETLDWIVRSQLDIKSVPLYFGACIFTCRVETSYIHCENDS